MRVGPPPTGVDNRSFEIWAVATDDPAASEEAVKKIAPPGRDVELLHWHLAEETIRPQTPAPLSAWLTFRRAEGERSHCKADQPEAASFAGGLSQKKAGGTERAAPSQWHPHRQANSVPAAPARRDMLKRLLDYRARRNSRCGHQRAAPHFRAAPSRQRRVVRQPAKRLSFATRRAALVPEARRFHG